MSFPASQSRLVVDAGFPRARWYREIAQPAARSVREGRGNSGVFGFTERHLQCVWYDASLRPVLLQSSDGEEIRVENPGRWNLEAGPDFLDAVLVIGPERRHIRGDVEIHIHPQDWQHHHHDEDARYRRVAAHVSYFPPAPGVDRLPPAVVRCALRDALKVDPCFSFDAIDVTAYPYAAVSAERQPCARLLASCSPGQQAEFLSAAGEERLHCKTRRLKAAIDEAGAEQVFYEECMAALGYKNNRAACRQLARILPVELLQAECRQDPLCAYALLLGMGGLLPSKLAARWDTETRRFVRALWDHWWKRQARWEAQRRHAPEWQFSGLRPQNHPVRRLAAAAALFATPRDLPSELMALDCESPSLWMKEAAGRIVGAADMPYWRCRLGLAGRRRERPVALVGKARAAAILTNVVLPLLAALGRDVAHLLDVLPADQDNALVRQTAHALFGPDHNPALYRQGLRQQGLIQIFHDFCLRSRNTCADCLLVDWLKKGGRLRDEH